MQQDNHVEHRVTTHGDKPHEATRFWATCACGWHSNDFLPDQKHGERRYIEARKAAWDLGKDHVAWWNKHPQLAHVGAFRSDAT